MNLQILEAGINISNQFINKRNIPAHYVIIKQHNRVHLQDIKNQFIKVSSIHVRYVELKHQVIVILLDIFCQNIKERNIRVNLVKKNIQIHQHSSIIINQFMKFACDQCDKHFAKQKKKKVEEFIELWL